MNETEVCMTNEQAKSELMQLYGSLSEEKKKALDVAFKAMERADRGFNEWCHDCKEYDQEKHCCPRFNRVIRETVAEIQEDGEKTCGTCRNEDTYHCAECENKSDYEQAQADGDLTIISTEILLKDAEREKLRQELLKQKEDGLIVLPWYCKVEIPSAEPCEDAISRKAILSKIKEVCFSKEWRQFRIDNGSNGQRDFLINYIEQLPSKPQEPKTVPIAVIRFDDDKLHEIVEEAVKNIEIEPKWIPVNERLPEEVGTYMTTVDYGKNGLATGQRYYHGKGLGWEDDCVTAWMPLPKPYEPQERSEE